MVPASVARSSSKPATATPPSSRLSFDPSNPVILRADPSAAPTAPSDHPIIRGIGQTWNLDAFTTPRRPISLAKLEPNELEQFRREDVTRVLDMPIKFPDNPEYRIPSALAQFTPTIQRIINFEHQINPEHQDYFAYLTIDQRTVAPQTLQREAPCHHSSLRVFPWQTLDGDAIQPGTPKTKPILRAWAVKG